MVRKYKGTLRTEGRNLYLSFDNPETIPTSWDITSESQIGGKHFFIADSWEDVGDKEKKIFCGSNHYSAKIYQEDDNIVFLPLLTICVE